MNRFTNWLLGTASGGVPAGDRERDQNLDAQLAEASQQRAEAQEFRRQAERIGPAIREGLRNNHFGDRIAYAMHQRGWSPE